MFPSHLQYKQLFKISILEFWNSKIVPTILGCIKKVLVNVCVCVCFFKKCFVYLFLLGFWLCFLFSLLCLLSSVCLFVLSFKKAALFHLIFKFAHDLIWNMLFQRILFKWTFMFAVSLSVRRRIWVCVSLRKRRMSYASYSRRALYENLEFIILFSTRMSNEIFCKTSISQPPCFHRYPNFT